MRKRIVSSVTALVMLISLLPVPTLAEDIQDEIGTELVTQIETEETTVEAAAAEEESRPEETTVETGSSEEEPQPEETTAETESSEEEPQPEETTAETESAEEESQPEETVPEVTVSDPIQAEETITVKTPNGLETLPVIRVEIPFQVNPRYEGVDDASDFDLTEGDSGPVLLTADYVSETEAAEQIRTYLHERIGQFTVCVQTRDTSYSSVTHSVFDQALAHTGEPTEGDYLAWQYGGWSSSISYSCDSLGNYYYTISYTVPYYSTASQEAELDARVATLLSQLGLDSKSDYEKFKGIYDYICANVTYDYENLNNTAYKLKRTAYAALINGTAVCQGYAVLLYRLALELGVDSRIVVGDAGGAHAWNIARVQGKYYNADSTWDAGRTTYQYFLVSPDNFTDHVRDAEYDTEDFHAAYPMATQNYAPADGSIASGICGTNLTWTLDSEGLLTISGTGAMYDFSNPCDSPWFKYLSQIVSVKLENGVTSIGENAFYAYTRLTSIAIPESVTSIGSNAFDSCSGLTAIAIPNSVTSIGYGAFNGCSGLTSITIPAGVTAINDDVFSSCSRLTSVTIPENVTSIGNGAFYGCTGLTAVKLSGGITEIGSEAFRDCTNLTSIDFPDSVQSIGARAFWACNGLTEVTIPEGVASMGEYTFYQCKKLKLVSIPSSLKVIGRGAFDDCKALTDVTISQGVTEIGENAFWDCSALTSITIPDGVTVIGDNAFRGCTAVNAISLGTGVTTIGEYAFADCKLVTELVIPEGVTTIEGYAFYECSGLESLTLPEGIDTIALRSFYGCSGLTSLTIPQGVTTIAEAAFQNCSGLTSVTLPDSVTYLGAGAFNGCTALTSIVIPRSIASIEHHAFYDCPMLTEIIFDHFSGDNLRIEENAFALDSDASLDTQILVMDTGSIHSAIRGYDWAGGKRNVTYVGRYLSYGVCGDNGDNLTYTLTRDGILTISGSGRMMNYDNQSSQAPWSRYRTKIVEIRLPQGLTEIGDYAFYGCRKVTEVTIPDNVTYINGDAFADCAALASVSLPDSLKEIWHNAFANCTSLTEITIPKGVTYFTGFSGCTSLRSVTIPEGVTQIGGYAFKDCTSLTEVKLPESVNYIGMSAFFGCTNLTSINIPDGITDIEESTFALCESLVSITIPESVLTIGWGAFIRCSSLTEITIPDSVYRIGEYAFQNCTGLTSVVIPEDVTKIEDFTFSYCSGLTSVTLPEGVTEIEDCAFSDCSGLTSVTLPGSVTTVGGAAFRGCSQASITIPKSVTSIGTYAFDGVLTYEGTMEEWMALGYIHSAVCSDGTIVTWGKCGENLTYTLLGNGLLTISGSGAMDDYDHNNNVRQPWREIADQITSVILTEGVTYIGRQAFFECGNLTSVTIPDSVTTIGGWAFHACYRLRDITIPENVTRVEDCAFYSAGLRSVTIPRNVTYIGRSAFSSSVIKDVTFTHQSTDSLTIEPYAFYTGKFETESIQVWVPDVQDIHPAISGHDWEQDYRDVTYRAILVTGSCGENVTWMLYPDTGALIISGEGEMNHYDDSDHAAPWRDYRSDILSVVISDGVTSIGDRAFSDCSSLTSITISEGVTSIGTGAFSDCSSLTSIALPDSVTIIKGSTFANCRSLSSITIPDSVTSIGTVAFSGCSNLSSITIPAGVTSIGVGAFEYCSSLTSITIPAGVTSIEGVTFNHCHNLNSITIPEGVTSIGDFAFYYCRSLTSILIPQNVTSIGNNAFDSCEQLSEIRFAGDAPAFAENAFAQVTAMAVYPTDNETWTEDVMQSYGGAITWVSEGNLLTILSQPADYVGGLNTTASFTVAVNREDVTYQWFYSSDGTTWRESSANGCNTDTLTIQLTALRLGQQYRCEITDSEGNTVVSNAAAMQLPPSTIAIQTQPVDYYGAVADQAPFTVEATGEGLTYRWYYSGTGGETWAESYSEGYETATLMPVLRAYNSGRMFKCLITDANGNTEWTQAVTMALASSEVTIVEQPASYTGAINDLTTFTVGAEGENLTYQWYFSTDGGTSWEMSYNEGYDTPSLKVRLYAYRSGYQYKCVITSGGSAIVETDPVTIAKKAATAAIKQQPLNAGGMVGTNVTFHVGAVGNGLRYQWQFSSDNGTTWGDTSMTGAKTDTLTVGVVAYRDGWQYRCVVTDDSGTSVTTVPAVLRVGAAPVITGQPESYNGPVGGTANFTVTVSGENLRYQWQYSNDGGTKWTDSGTTGANTASIAVSALAYRNGQQYRCVVTNEYGSVISDAAVLTIK